MNMEKMTTCPSDTRDILPSERFHLQLLALKENNLKEVKRLAEEAKEKRELSFKGKLF